MIVLLLLATLLLSYGYALQIIPHPIVSRDHYALSSRCMSVSNNDVSMLFPKKSRDIKELNWMESISPLNEENESEDLISREVGDYNIGISGQSFQTGPLSTRIYEAICGRQNKSGIISAEIISSWKLFAMDLTAREATNLALKQNGFSLYNEEDMEQWGVIDSIQFIDNTGHIIGPTYDNLISAVDNWIPGQGFNFVARGVRAKGVDLELEDVLDALDPDGALRKGAEDAGIAIPTEELQSLSDLYNEVTRRCEDAPRRTYSEKEVYIGQNTRGYSVISRSDLLLDAANPDGSENKKTLMHVMNALVSHGCLIVDLTDNGKCNKLSQAISQMWTGCENFFHTVTDLKKEELLPKMKSIPASPFAKMGYANFNNGMKFMETRIDRLTGSVLPTELSLLIGDAGLKELEEGFKIIADVGKDVVRIATAASSVENEGFQRLNFESGNQVDANIQSSISAKLMVDELIDDGRIVAGMEGQGSISMSPHRFCSYSNIEGDGPSEVFGAHTDSSFVTVIPVASVSGLEVYDEDAERWYRPELRARLFWEAQQGTKEIKVGSFDEVEIGGKMIEIPWHARYLIVIPGEFLQIVSRNEITAAVHRVVASKVSRISAPVLLRGRPGVPMDVKKYLGAVNSQLLLEVDGLEMQKIHDSLQPRAK